jgi:hypothetical protein
MNGPVCHWGRLTSDKQSSLLGPFISCEGRFVGCQWCMCLWQMFCHEHWWPLCLLRWVSSLVIDASKGPYKPNKKSNDGQVFEHSSANSATNVSNE